MTTIPDFIPVLSAGAHDDPSEGACVMEMVSFLAGEAWSDFPTCTNSSLAMVAQSINDHLDDEERAEFLLPLIPRLMGTGQTPDDVYRQLGSMRIKAYRERLRRVSDLGNSVSLATRDVMRPALIAMLDYYDEATGRQSKAELPDTTTLRRMAELTGASK